MFWPRKDPVKALMERAQIAAQEAVDCPDEVHITISKDGKRCVLQIVLDGEPSDWISFDARQLDGVITALKAARGQLR